MYIKKSKLTINIPQGWGLATGLEEMDEGRHGVEVEESELADVHSAPRTECTSCDMQWNTFHTCNPALPQTYKINSVRLAY
jgi:hypothetical protein